MSVWFYLVAQFAILAYALIGGVFLAFSDFLMRSLAKTSGPGGIEAMQSINREVFRWVFIPLFLAMAPVSLVLAGYGLVVLGGTTGATTAAAGVVYLVACFGVTIRCNVPMNQALAAMDATSDAARAYWRRTYLPRWTMWNTVRTVASLAAAALLLIGLSTARLG